MYSIGAILVIEQDVIASENQVTREHFNDDHDVNLLFLNLHIPRTRR